MKIQRLFICGRYYGRIAVANTFFLRLRGMLGRNFTDFDAIMITPCGNIHTMFMAYPIDVLFVNERYQIEKVVENVEPWILYVGSSKAISVIELPAGKANEHGIKSGMPYQIK